MSLVLAAAACAGEREREGPREACPSWQDEIAAELARACGGCHEGDDAEAGYDLSSYEGVIAEGEAGSPNAIAGDEDSTILRAADPDRAEPPHDEAADADLFASLERWVVDCDLAYLDSRVHEPGLMNPRDGEFHGALLRESGWAFEECASCHGDDFEGGVSESSCTSCHEDGPTTCETCHGDLEESDPHAAHLQDGPLAGAYTCEACHPTPDDYRDPGHIFDEEGESLDEPARVELGALANHTPPGAEREAAANFDRETKTCSNVYCHGDVDADPEAAHTRPTWTEHPGQADCGSCHGDPPADHASARCGQCHGSVARVDSREFDFDRHISGEVHLRGDSQDCAGCHGEGERGGPPPDLDGRKSTASLGVGAHRAHLETGISEPIDCEACHIVPDELQSPGHIDTPPPAEVFPDGHDSLAHAGGAEPSWDRETATCSDVYCHGGGRLGADEAPEVNREPVWTAVGEGEAACGGCHGIPPEDGDHDPDMGLRDCHDCHGDTVDRFGNIVVTGPPGARSSAHIDGEPDAD